MVRNKRNIRSFAAGSFRPHGEVELWDEGPMMHFTARGPFNREAVQALGAAVRDLQQSLGPARTRVELIEFRGSLLASPDALTELGHLLGLMSAAGTAQLGIALVVADDVEARSLMLPIFMKLYADHGRPVASFDGVEAAKAWLRQLLAVRS